MFLLKVRRRQLNVFSENRNPSMRFPLSKEQSIWLLLGQSSDAGWILPRNALSKPVVSIPDSLATNILFSQIEAMTFGLFITFHIRVYKCAVPPFPSNQQL